MLEARKSNIIRAESNRVTLQSQQYNKLIEDLKAKANADLAPDGDIDIANEELEQLIKQYQMYLAEGVVHNSKVCRNILRTRSGINFYGSMECSHCTW